MRIIIHFQCDHEVLAMRIHQDSDHIAKQIFDKDFLFKHLKANADVFSIEDMSVDPNEDPLYLIHQIHKTQHTMSEILTQLKAADDKLAAEVQEIGTAVDSLSTRISNDLQALNEQITHLNSQGALNIADVQTEISRVQNNADELGNIVAKIKGIDAQKAEEGMGLPDAPGTANPQSDPAPVPDPVPTAEGEQS